MTVKFVIEIHTPENADEDTLAEALAVADPMTRNLNFEFDGTETTALLVRVEDYQPAVEGVIGDGGWKQEVEDLDRRWNEAKGVDFS